MAQLSRVTDPNSSPTGVSLKPSVGSQLSVYVDLWQRRASGHAHVYYGTLSCGGGSQGAAPWPQEGDRPTLSFYVCTLASRRCWPTATSCISSRRNILTEHVGCHQKNFYGRTFIRVMATTRCFVQASYSSRPPTQIRATVGLTQCSYGVRNKVEKFKQNQPHKKEVGTLYTQTAKTQPNIDGYKKKKYC